MALKQIREKAKYFLRNNRVEKISSDMFQVDKDLVSIRIKSGRTITSCSCINYSTFVTSGQLCSHILSALLFDTYNPLSEEIEKMKIQYEKYKKLGFDIKPQIMLDDLEKLKIKLNE